MSASRPRRRREGPIFAASSSRPPTSVVSRRRYKRARADGATQRADWYAAVWRDVRRALHGARPIREYQQKYKLLIAEKKRQRMARPPPGLDDYRNAAPPQDDGTRVEEF